MKIFRDKDGDLWAPHADGSMICIAESTHLDLEAGAEPGRPRSETEERFGPLTELVMARPVDAETLDRMADAFGVGWHAEDRERDGMSRAGDRRRAGLTEALKVIGIEADQDWRRG